MATNPDPGFSSDSIPVHNSGFGHPNFPDMNPDPGFHASLGNAGAAIRRAVVDPHSGQYADYRAAATNRFKAKAPQANFKSPKK